MMSRLSTMGSLPLLIVVMLISGSCNTLLMKFMVMQKVPTGPGEAVSGFDHPYFQSLLMMFGEFLCLVTYWCTRKREEEDVVQSGKAPVYIFLVACLFDWTATTLVNMAYGVIAASVVQMTRGAVVVFTCLFSMVFLGRRQYAYHMLGVFFVTFGITLVSLSSFLTPATKSQTEATTSVWPRVLGISLCILAQVFQASMLVYEEKIMSKYTLPPLQVVGMEGTCGIVFGVILLAFLNATHVESTPVAYYQLTHCKPLLFAAIASIFSIAFFNYSGVTVTQQASAVARSTIDVSRTIIIWMVELSLGWNSFNALQFGGFFFVAVGTLIYNRLIVIPKLEPPAELIPFAKAVNQHEA